MSELWVSVKCSILMEMRDYIRIKYKKREFDFSKYSIVIERKDKGTVKITMLKELAIALDVYEDVPS